MEITRLNSDDACTIEPTMNLRFRDVRTQIGFENYKYIRTLQQMWIDKNTGYTEWIAVKLDNSSKG